MKTFLPVLGAVTEHGEKVLRIDCAKLVEEAGPGGDFVVTFQSPDGYRTHPAFREEGATIFIPIVNDMTQTVGMCIVGVAYFNAGRCARDMHYTYTLPRLDTCPLR